ncbi:MAG: outer membrane protein assembly factor BamE [Pseudomonadota bacterium]
MPRVKPIQQLGRLLCLIVLIGSCSACVYRLAIQQGNIAKLDDVERVEVGMTPSQVRFLLGSPLVDDPFSSDRWDYVFSSRIGRDAQTTRRFLTVYFEDGKVARIVREDPPPLEPDTPEPVAETEADS